MKAIITTLFTALSAPALAEGIDLDLTLSRSATQSADVRDGYEFKGSVIAGNWDVWASYGEHDQIIITQSVGDLSILAVGIGYQHGWRDFITAYLDAGLADISTTEKDRVLKEAIWFSFCPTFCPAHWQPDENYLDPDITVKTEFDPAAVIRGGMQIHATDRLSFDLSYRYLHAKQFMVIRNSTTADQHGWWEGEFSRDLSGVNIGFNWRF